MIKTIDKMIRCKRKCHNLKIRTSISTGAAPLDHRDKTLDRATIGRDKDRTHFSKCNNNLPFRGARISLKGSDSSTIKHTIQWTSRTRPIHRSLPIRRHRIQGKAAAHHHPPKKTSILVTMPIRCVPQAPWAQPKVVKLVHRLASKICRR